MRDYLLEKICDLEDWLRIRGKRLVNWPLAALVLVLLIFVLMLSNLAAVGSIALGWLVPGKQTPKKRNEPAILDLETDGQLDEILKSSKFVLVDFWAAWCGPCMMMKPALHSIAKTFAGEVIVVTIDSSRFGQLSKAYSVAGLPTLLFFEDGELVEQHAGALSENHLTEMIRQRFRIR